MHTPEPWEAHRTVADFAVMSRDKFIAHFEIDEHVGSSLDEVAANADRTVECVNACAGIPNPTRMIEEWRADARYLEMYREAYSANVARLTRMTGRVRVLRDEALAMREVVYEDEAGTRHTKLDRHLYDPARDARQKVDLTDALTCDLEADHRDRPDVSQFRGIDPLALQMLARAAETVLTERTEAAFADLELSLDLLKRGKQQ